MSCVCNNLPNGPGIFTTYRPQLKIAYSLTTRSGKWATVRCWSSGNLQPYIYFVISDCCFCNFHFISICLVFLVIFVIFYFTCFAICQFSFSVFRLLLRILRITALLHTHTHTHLWHTHTITYMSLWGSLLSRNLITALALKDSYQAVRQNNVFYGEQSFDIRARFLPTHQSPEVELQNEKQKIEKKY